MRLLLNIFLVILSLECFAAKIKVTRIIDGDTFETETHEKVRLVGINAPEITDIFGQEAKQHLSSIIENQFVDLLPDHTSNDRDRYGRLLRYVILNGVDINKQMVTDGYAFAYLKYHFDKEKEYTQAQVNSKQLGNGIWNNSAKVKDENNKPFFRSSLNKIVIISGLIFSLFVIAFIYYFKK